MKLIIESIGDNIFIKKDFIKIKTRGEISNMIAELELVKLDLLEIWELWDDDKDEKN